MMHDRLIVVAVRMHGCCDVNNSLYLFVNVCNVGVFLL